MKEIFSKNYIAIITVTLNLVLWASTVIWGASKWTATIQYLDKRVIVLEATQTKIQEEVRLLLQDGTLPLKAHIVTDDRDMGNFNQRLTIIENQIQKINVIANDIGWMKNFLLVLYNTDASASDISRERVSKALDQVNRSNALNNPTIP